MCHGSARPPRRNASPVPPRRLRDAGCADADRAHRRRGAADRLGPRLPELAEVRRHAAAAAELARADRVRQPGRLGHRRDSSRWSRRSLRLHAPAVPPRPGDLALLLPLGVLARRCSAASRSATHLAPGFVMAHFSLSLLILIAAVRSGWRATYEPGSRPRVARTAPSVWSVRALCRSARLTIFAGTAATAAGPHAGGFDGSGDPPPALQGRRHARLDVHQHATIAAIFGVAVIGVVVPAAAPRRPAQELEPLTVLGVLLAAQGLVGSVQYELQAAQRDGLGPRVPGYGHMADLAVGGGGGRPAGAARRGVPASGRGAPAPELELAGRR